MKIRAWIVAWACISVSISAQEVPLGSNFWPFGTIINPWPQTQPFVDEIYTTSGAAFATIDDPWNPNYLAELAPYDHFRFMDWGRVNSSMVDHWSDRRQKADVQDCTFKDDNVGVAYEWMAHLCNTLDADMWFCIPHLLITRDGVERGANDFMRKLAILLKYGVDMGAVDLVPLQPLDGRDKAFFLSNGGVETGPALNPNLDLYIEYSNETWNFPVQRNHCIAEGLALGLAANEYTAGFMYHAWAATRMFEEFEDVFGAGSPQLVRVSATQTSDWQVGKHLEIFRSATHNPRGIMPDAFAGTFYAGQKDSSNTQIDGAALDLAAQLDDSLHNKYELSWQSLRAAVDQAEIADGRNYLMVAYEGGQHITINADVASENPVMYDFYQDLLDTADQYYDIMSHYTHDGRPSSGGAWGAVKATTLGGFDYSQSSLEQPGNGCTAQC